MPTQQFVSTDSRGGLT